MRTSSGGSISVWARPLAEEAGAGILLHFVWRAHLGVNELTVVKILDLGMQLFLQVLEILYILPESLASGS